MLVQRWMGEDLQVGRAEQIKKQQLNIAMHSMHALRHVMESSNSLLAHHLLSISSESSSCLQDTLRTPLLKGNTDLRLLYKI